MSFSLSRKSLGKLGGVHPDLIKVVKRAIELTSVDFGITEGLRSITRQKELYAQGRTTPGKIVTKTMRSRHLTGHAVDIVAYKDGKISWANHLYAKIAKAFYEAAEEYDILIKWGHDIQGLDDDAHFELDKEKYP